MCLRAIEVSHAYDLYCLFGHCHVISASKYNRKWKLCALVCHRWFGQHRMHKSNESRVHKVCSYSIFHLFSTKSGFRLIRSVNIRIDERVSSCRLDKTTFHRSILKRRDKEGMTGHMVSIWPEPRATISAIRKKIHETPRRCRSKWYILNGFFEPFSTIRMMLVLCPQANIAFKRSPAFENDIEVFAFTSLRSQQKRLPIFFFCVSRNFYSFCVRLSFHDDACSVEPVDQAKRFS